MKIVAINEKNIEYFYGMDPFSYLAEKMPDNYFALGAALENDSADEAAGLMICESYQNVLIIRWLFVAPELRGRGYGDELLSAAFDAATSVHKDSIAAVMGKEKERSFVCPGEREFFELHGFDTEAYVGDYEDPMLLAAVG